MPSIYADWYRGVSVNSMWILFSRHTRCRTSKTLSPSVNAASTGCRIQPSAGTSDCFSALQSSIWSGMLAQEMETVQVRSPVWLFALGPASRK